MENNRFRFERVLLIDNNTKIINILGNYGGDQKAIMLLSKKPFPQIDSDQNYE